MVTWLVVSSLEFNRAKTSTTLFARRKLWWTELLYLIDGYDITWKIDLKVFNYYNKILS